MTSLLVWTCAALAQVNTDNLAAAAAEEGVGIQFATSGSWSTGNVDFLSVVLATQVRWVLVPDELTLTETAYIEPRVDDPGDIQVINYFVLTSTITKALSMTGSLTVRHDSRPPLPVERTDVTLSWGLTLRLAARPDPHEPH
ncbi:MAG: DUF481 domain-containing protein [Myxococcota bacterium]